MLTTFLLGLFFVTLVITLTSMLQRKIEATNVFILNFFYLSCEFSFLTDLDGLSLFHRKLGPLWKLYFKKLDITKYIKPDEITLLGMVVSFDKEMLRRFTPEYVSRITHRAFEIACSERDI